jgi:hypothetical protein
MELLIWNAILSFVSAITVLALKSYADEVKRLQILLNRTREEMAKEYITRADVHHDFARVMDRLDRLDNKIDALIKEHRSALN